MLVAFVHGANVPLIINTIKKQLDFEHKVLEGLEVRKEVSFSLSKIFLKI